MSSEDEIIIAVMGVTGAGKSTFINNALGHERARVSHELQPGTHEVKSYGLYYRRINFLLVDTPGFDDTNFSDTDILRMLLKWLQESYSAGQKLTAILYLHRITDTRMQGSALRNFTMFKKLCGEGCYKNVVLGTTFWEIAIDHPGYEVAEGRETELIETKQFWGGMVEKGSEVVRIPDSIYKARELLCRLAKKSTVTLLAQEEIGKKGKSFDQTAASQVLQDELAKEKAEAERAKKRLQEEHEYKMNLIEKQRKAKEEAQRKEHEQKLADQDRERKRLEREREKEEAEKTKREAEAAAKLERMRREQEKLETRMANMKLEREHEARSLKVQKWVTEVQEWFELLAEGIKAGKVLCNFRELALAYNRICDHCFKSIGSGTYYQCKICADGNFMLCEPCYGASDVYCAGGRGHFGDLERHVEEDTQGDCPRVTRPYAPGSTLGCSRCFGPTGVVYLHCCLCDGDNFDMCIKCAFDGRTCKKSLSLSGHLLDICSRYIE